MNLINQLHSDYVGNLSKVENVVDYLFVIDQCPFLLRICILIGVIVKNFCFFFSYNLLH